ncbi:MAG: class I SAM-dependent methyltransferase [Thiobacillus sp.]|nr:class I SAM-dependent methyltransferase [Thiobacillus sp.]MDP3126666.1 class I SAM-dependent methyltransferase [Thiobacillus sp.]
MTTAHLPLVALPCRICGQAAPHRLAAKGDRSGESIKVYFCGACNAHFTAPPDFDYETQDEGLIAYYEAHRDYILWRHNRIFDYLERAFGLAHGRFLDIGSGAGYSLEVAAKRGWDAQGIEPGSTLAEYSQARLGGHVIHGYFTPDLRANLQAANPAGYDYLLIDNVLEHVSDPVGFMEQALGLLAERGVALVAIPPVDWLRVMLGCNSLVRARSHSAQINLFYDPEQHVNYFSRRAMRRLVEERLGYTLLLNHFHHSRILDNPLARFCGFETGYFFIARSAGKG